MRATIAATLGYAREKAARIEFNITAEERDYTLMKMKGRLANEADVYTREMKSHRRGEHCSPADLNFI